MASKRLAEPRIAFTVRLPPSTLEKLRLEYAYTGRSLQSMIEEAIRDWLGRRGPARTVPVAAKALTGQRSSAGPSPAPAEEGV